MPVHKYPKYKYENTQMQSVCWQKYTKQKLQMHTWRLVAYELHKGAGGKAIAPSEAVLWIKLLPELGRKSRYYNI